MRQRLTVVIALAGATALAACDHNSNPTDPTTARSSSTGGTDTSTTAPPTHPPANPPGNPPAGPDTGSTYHGSVQLSVRVVAYVHLNTPVGQDTLQLQVVSDAEVFVSPITIEGVGAAQSLGRTNAQGLVSTTVPSGPYVIRAVPRAGSGFNASETSILADHATVQAQVNVWKNN